MTEIPKELQYLIPKPEQIVIGSEIVELHPLTLGRWRAILEKIKDATETVFNKEVIDLLENQKEITGVIGPRIVGALKDKIGPILAVALDKDEAEIEKNITTEQITFAIIKLWNMNLKRPIVDMRGLVTSVSSMLPTQPVQPESK